MAKVTLIAKTEISNKKLEAELKNSSAEELIMYCARVSNPKNQTSGNPGLLKYCAEHGHWSIFEMANMIVEVETSRAIAAQILRHKSLNFQEFSQRYKEITAFDDTFEIYDARSQDPKNRQNSINNMSEDDRLWFESAQLDVQQLALIKYEEALSRGVAKEQARFLLPQNVKTRLYINGTLRSWIHYLQLRTGNGTQLEHQEIANSIKEIFTKEFPIISKSLNWSN